MGLVRDTVCHYCLGGCSALVWCAQRSRQVRGVGAGDSCPPPPWCPPPPSRSSRCVMRVVPSGVFLPLPAGTPFHAVSAFRRLGPVAFQVRAVCLLCVCALLLPRRTPPPPGSVWRAHRARFLWGSQVGPFQAVFAPPRFVPRSRAPPIWLGGGGWPGRFAPLPRSRWLAPLLVGLCSGRSSVRRGVGGKNFRGGGLRAASLGGAVGPGSVRGASGW